MPFCYCTFLWFRSSRSLMERRFILLHFYLVVCWFFFPFLGCFSSNSMSINFPWTLAVTASRELRVVLVIHSTLRTGHQEEREPGKRCRASAICAVGSRSCGSHLLFLPAMALHVQDRELLLLASPPACNAVTFNRWHAGG